MEAIDKDIQASLEADCISELFSTIVQKHPEALQAANLMLKAVNHFAPVTVDPASLIVRKGFDKLVDAYSSFIEQSAEKEDFYFDWYDMDVCKKRTIRFFFSVELVSDAYLFDMVHITNDSSIDVYTLATFLYIFGAVVTLNTALMDCHNRAVRDYASGIHDDFFKAFDQLVEENDGILSELSDNRDFSGKRSSKVLALFTQSRSFLKLQEEDFMEDVEEYLSVLLEMNNHYKSPYAIEYEQMVINKAVEKSNSGYYALRRDIERNASTSVRNDLLKLLRHLGDCQAEFPFATFSTGDLLFFSEEICDTAANASQEGSLSFTGNTSISLKRMGRLAVMGREEARASVLQELSPIMKRCRRIYSLLYKF